MRYAIALLTLFVMTGCAAKKKPVPKVNVPQRCIVGGAVNASECKLFSKDEAVCNGVVIKLACIEVKK